MYHRYGGIEIGNAVDLQVLYVNAQAPRPMYLPTYGKVLRQILTREECLRLETIKKAGQEIFAAERGGTYAVWAERPLKPMLVIYASVDVCLLFRVYEMCLQECQCASAGSRALLGGGRTGGSGGSGGALEAAMRATAARMRRICLRSELPWPWGREWSLLDF